MEGTLAKKTRVWNPAMDNNGVIDDKLISEQDQCSDAPVNVSRVPDSSLLFVIQNYFHAARIQHQRVVEESFRRGFFSPFQIPPIMTFPIRQSNLPTIMPPPLQAIAPLLQTTSASSSMSGCGGSANPLVQAALGGRIANENCCAICGSNFRLTADLVQHMRSNHRRTRFKRKNEKSFLENSWRSDQ